MCSNSTGLSRHGTVVKISSVEREKGANAVPVENQKGIITVYKVYGVRTYWFSRGTILCGIKVLLALSCQCNIHMQCSLRFSAISSVNQQRPVSNFSLKCTGVNPQTKIYSSGGYCPLNERYPIPLDV